VVLQWLRMDAEGKAKNAGVPLFSNELGEPLKNVQKAWVVAVLKAHGVDLHWRKGAYKDLTAECQERFREIKLHWHDLRHEYASRLVERGVPLAQVRDLLGHASILTTERYDRRAARSGRLSLPIPGRLRYRTPLTTRGWTNKHRGSRMFGSEAVAMPSSPRSVELAPGINGNHVSARPRSCLGAVSNAEPATAAVFERHPDAACL
jgi:hypothetical protein